MRSDTQKQFSQGGYKMLKYIMLLYNWPEKKLSKLARETNPAG